MVKAAPVPPPGRPSPAVVNRRRRIHRLFTLRFTLFNLLHPKSNESGQAMPEYALILSLVSVAAITALTALGANISNVLDTLGAAL
jgi:Flp pilus assembly pilin Flp